MGGTNARDMPLAGVFFGWLSESFSGARATDYWQWQVSGAGVLMRSANVPRREPR